MTAMFPLPFGIAVMVRRGVRDRHGDISYADSHQIYGCAMAPRYSSEVTDNRNSVIVGFSLFGPPDADILGDDRVVAPYPGGNEYRVVGEAAVWGPHPMTGWRAGFEAALERIT